MDEENVKRTGAGKEDVQVVILPSKIQDPTLHQTPLLPRKSQKYLPHVS